MFFRKNRVKVKTYWTLVETYRTERGPRQSVISYLGDINEPVRKGVEALAEERPRIVQNALFDEDIAPDWQTVDKGRIKAERPRAFGDWWVGLWLMDKLGLSELLDSLPPTGHEDVSWRTMAIASVLRRLCEPSSELHVAQSIYERSPLPDLLGVSRDKVNDDRLYRTLDRLQPHKAALEKHLCERLGTLFEMEYDLLLYDVTSTFFEGASAGNAGARRGYSRDQRSDFKQVNIALVVSRCGLPLGFEMFSGNTHDSMTIQHIVATMEDRYGKADRVWVMDRGMVSLKNIDFLKKRGKCCVIGAPKAQLHQQEGASDARKVRGAYRIRLVPHCGRLSPTQTHTGPAGDAGRSPARKE